MAVPIIGASEPEPQFVLDEPEALIPPPGSAPEAQPVLGDEQVKKLLSESEALVRRFALEQITARPGNAWTAPLLALLDDPDPLVRIDAITVLKDQKCADAVPAIKASFVSSNGGLAAAAAEALGELAPSELLAALKDRGRLDDEAFTGLCFAVASSGADGAKEYFEAALNRAGALKPERRSALYASALLSGISDISGRVLDLAISDSHTEELGASFSPTRGALAMLAGLSVPASRQEHGEQVYGDLCPKIEHLGGPFLSEDQQKELAKALRAYDLDRVFDLLSAANPPAHTDDPTALLARQSALWDGFIERKSAIARLPQKAAGILMAALAEVLAAKRAQQDLQEPASGVTSLAKVLNISSDALLSLSEDALGEQFAQKSEREMRGALRTLSLPMHPHALIERVASAAFKSGHGRGVISLGSEIKDGMVLSAILAAGAKHPAQVEPALVEFFSEQPLETKSAALALLLAEKVRTERVALQIARRFFELRAASRHALARAVVCLGHSSFLPLLESRAFKNEPEEVAWTVLSLAHGQPVEGKLKQAIENHNRMSDHTHPEQALPLELTLACSRCKEALSYRFERALIDVAAKGASGDPAFVGDVRCKACSAEDTLETTPESVNVLTMHMMQFLEQMQSGQVTGSPPVMPAQTELGGRTMGFKAALTQLNQDIKKTPDSIRPRLHRARVRLVLKRSGVDEDLKAVLNEDPGSVEAKALMAVVAMRSGRSEEAAELAFESLRLFSQDPAPRLYDTEQAQKLREDLEGYVLELQALGQTLPADINLDAARARQAEQEPHDENQGHVHDENCGHNHEAPGAAPQGGGEVAVVGRNEPCPCGSGKKYKKCHARKGA